MGFSYQHIVRSGTSFTDSSDFLAQTTALWDFPLKDLTQTPNDTYCLRLTSLDSSVTIDSYDVYAEVSSFEGEITVRSVDSSGDEVTGMGTNTLFSEAVISAATQTSTAFLTDSLTKQLEIHNSQSANGWNVTLAAANGEFSAWTHGTDSYPYNSSALNGRMGVDLSTSTVQGVGEDLVGQPCSSTTGIAKPNSTSYFANGTTSSITLLSGSSSSQLGCNWRLSSILLS